MNLHPTTKRGILLGLIALAIFGTASAFGRAKGSDIILEVANQFHAARCVQWRNENNTPKLIEEYKAWLWLDPNHLERSATLAELHLQQDQPFEAYNRIVPLLESMENDNYTLCRLMTLIRTAQHDPEALDWAKRTLAVANDTQKEHAQSLLNATH